MDKGGGGGGNMGGIGDMVAPLDGGRDERHRWGWEIWHSLWNVGVGPEVGTTFRNMGALPFTNYAFSVKLI